MSNSQLYIGSTPIHAKKSGGEGEYLRMNGETWCKISGFDAMETFFMTIVSSSDHWMFIASNGSLTAGRKNPESALFPYYTDDKIIDSPEITGSKTIFRVLKDDKLFYNINEHSKFYFVHNYYFESENEKDVIAQTEYDIIFPSVVKKENIVGTQFHPEKSQNHGIQFLYNFLKSYDLL